MKHAKKLASLLLALVMLLALGTTAFATGNDGSITVTNATVDKNYSVYKVFDLTYDANDTTKVAYTYTAKTGTDDFLTALQGETSPFTLVEVPANSGKYNVTLKEGKTPAEVSTFLTAQKNNMTVTATQKATTSTLTFTGLAHGYYFLTSELGTTITIDSTLPNVSVIDKNQTPTWDNGDNPGEVGPGKVITTEPDSDGNYEKLTENTVNYGDTVNFSIAINATSHVGDQEVTYYYITDTLAAGFDAAENITVYVAGAEKTVVTDYTLTQTGNTFQVTVPHKAEYGANYKIEVKYSATVNNSAVLANPGNKNTANFTYDTKTPGTPTPDPKPTPTYPEENKRETTTYVYALGILKVDPKGNPLKGAEFTVSGENGSISAKATATPGVYEYCAAGTEGAVTQFKTNENGVLTIKGLAAGTYDVTETVAPAGYNLLKDPVQVEAKLKEAYTETITVYKDADGNVTSEVTTNTVTHTAAANVAPLVVVNQAGTELPSTGGMGTTLFYVLGGVLVVGAAVLLVVKKRMGRAAR